MTATRKILLAIVLVSTGYGVARLLGEPAAREYLPLPHIGFLSTEKAASVPLPPNRPRLLPDYGIEEVKPAIDSTLAEIAPPLFSPPKPLATPLADNRSVANSETHVVQSPPSTRLPFAPRAKLRDEAPRALAIDEPRATAPALPPTPVITPLAEQENRPEAPKSAAPPILPPPAFAHNFESQPVITASYYETRPMETMTPVVPVTPLTPVTPLPAREELEPAEPRTHIIIDGDSLPKLAGRYLGDPHRSGEIFEANRGVLSDPELLPIGAELAIPSRTNPAAIGAASPQSRMPRSVASHNSATGGLVPVRPIPTTGLPPRAQLLRPIAPE